MEESASSHAASLNWQLQKTVKCIRIVIAKTNSYLTSELLPFLCKVPMLYIYQSQSNGDLAIPSLISLRGKTNDEDIFRSLPDFLSIINKEK